MQDVFLKLVNMSVTAAWTVAAVLVLRLALHRAPRWIRCAMWSVVAIRLIMPFGIKSGVSLIPSVNTFSGGGSVSAPSVNTGLLALNSYVNPAVTGHYDGAPSTPDFLDVAAWVWAFVAILMLLYMVGSYFLVRLRVAESVRLYDNVYICDRVSSPFILGVLFPRIYLHSSVSDTDLQYVVAHERAHIKRLDHILKPLGFVLLSLHWFNPLLWVAYILFCRDVEYACDERVLKKLDADGKKAYSRALVNCAARERIFTACPLAFGESGIKGRVKNALSFKKPAVWVLILSVILSAVLALCFLTDPDGVRGIASQKNSSGEVSASVTDFESSGISPYLRIKIKNGTQKTVYFGEEFYIYKKDGDSWTDCRVGDYVFTLPQIMVLEGKSINKNYYLSGMDMSETGVYKFETYYTVGKESKKHTLWVEFELTTPVLVHGGFELEVTELEYSCGMFSFVPDPDAVKGDKYTLSGMMLSKVNDDSPSSLIGAFEEIALDDDTFSKRITDNDRAVLSLQKNNKRAWQLNTREYDNDVIYLLLEQKNGDFYLCYGYYNMNTEPPVTPDSSLIRYIYKVKVREWAPDEAEPTVMFDAYHYKEASDSVNGSSIYLFFDGTFSFNLHPFSSYAGIGKYVKTDDYLLLKTDDGKNRYHFDIKDGALVFNASLSSFIPSFEGKVAIPDGAVFTK